MKYNMYTPLTRKQQQGYSLVEVLVAIAVLMIAIVGPMTIAAQGVRASTYALEQNTAFFLAQEGIELLFQVRDSYQLQDIATSGGVNAWDWVNTLNPICGSSWTSCTFGLDSRDSSYLAAGSQNWSGVQCTGTNRNRCRLYVQEASAPRAYSHVVNSTPSAYTRTILVEKVGTNAVRATVTVYWLSGVFGANERDYTVTTYLYDIL